MAKGQAAQPAQPPPPPAGGGAPDESAPAADPPAAPRVTLHVDVSIQLADQSEDGAPPEHHALEGCTFKCTFDAAAEHAPAETQLPIATPQPLTARAEASIQLDVSSELVVATADAGGPVLRLLTAAGEEAATFAADLWPLVRGEAEALTTYASAPTARSDRALPALPAALEPLSRLSVRLRLGSGERLLDDELTRELNPMTFEIVRAEGLPPDYSGNSGLGGPFEELARSCGHVYVSLRLPQGLGTFVTTSQPHASTLRWNEKRTIFAGTLDPQSLLTELSSEALELELHDRDPLPKAARAAAEGSGANDDSAAGGGAAAAEAAEGAPAAAGEDAAATAADDKLKQPFGVASVNLAALVPKPHGDRPDVKAFASRRQTVVVQVVPSERAAERAPPDSSTFPFFPVDTLPYYPGKYVENGTCVTIKVESAVPLRARPRGFEHDLQRVVVTMRYDDTKLLGRMSRVIEQVNSMSGVSSTSSWSEYKASGLADERLDCLSGFQLTDGTLRLFVVEGGFARWEAGTGADDDQPQPLNGMAALAVVLRRTDASERKLGRRYLTNWKLHFPKRLYTAFETPLKLIKLRQPFSELMSKPNVYVHGRVPEACARALTRIFSTLAMDRLRDMHKNSLWVPVDALLELDKKFGDVLTVADRHGVRENTVEVERDAVRGAAKDASGTQDGEAEAERVPVSKNKADTDSRLPTSFAESIRARRTREPLDYVKRNAEPLVCANPLRPKRVFEFSRDDLAGPDGQVYIYSSQRYSSAMLHQAQLRKACQEEAERTGVLRTYNAEYLSAAEIGEESEDESGDEREGRGSEWDSSGPQILLWDQRQYDKTGDGWVRSLWQIKQPDPGRLDYIRQPWVEPQPGKQNAGIVREEADEGAPKGKPEWVVPSDRGGDYFTQDPGWFKSIFVPDPAEGVDGLEAEEKARQQLEAHRWKQKVLVDDITFHAAKSDVPKHVGILHDSPQKRAIRRLYRGKRPLVAMPPTTIFPKEDNNFDFADFLRQTEPSKWTARNGLTGEPDDFLLHWAADDTTLEAHKPKPKPKELKPLTQGELDAHAGMFRRAPQLTRSSLPRLVPKEEFFSDSSLRR